MGDIIQSLKDAILSPLSTPASESSVTTSNSLSTDTLDTAVGASQGILIQSLFNPSVPSLPRGRISLQDYFNAVNTSIDNSNLEQQQTNQLTWIINAAFWWGASIDATGLLQARANMITESNKETTLYAEQQSQIKDYNSGPVANYNTFLGSASGQTLTMHNAQQTYIAGTVTPATTAQYNAAVSTWNSQVSGLNAQLASQYATYLKATNDLNAQITQNNAQIDSLNANRKSLGITTLIPHQNLVSIAPPPATLQTVAPGPPPPAAPTVPAGFSAVSPAPGLPAGSTPPSSTAAFLAKFFDPFFAAQLLASNIFFNNQELIDAQDASNIFSNQGASSSIVQAPADIEDASLGSSPVAGAGLLTSILGLGSKGLSLVLSQHILDLVDEALETHTSEAAKALISTSLAKALQTGFLSSGIPAAALLGDNVDVAANGGTAGSTALSLAFTSTMNKLVETKFIGNLTETALQDSGASPEDVAKLSGPIGSGVKLGVLLLTLFSTAKALGMPGLITQVLANSGAPGSGSPYGLNDVLKNPLSGSILKQKLVDQVVGNGTWDSSTAEAQINSVINKVTDRASYSNNFEFAIGLLRGFKAAGLDDSTAAALAQQAQDFVRGERLIGDKDSAFHPQALTDAYRNDTTGLFSTVREAVNATLANTYQTKREFGDALTQQLVNQGHEESAAVRLSDNVLLAIRSDTQKRSFNSQNVDHSQLQTSLTNGLVANGIEPGQAASTASAVTSNALASKFSSELLLRETIAGQLQIQGINSNTAATLSEQARLALTNVNPLLDARSNQVLNNQQLREALSSVITNRLKKELGIEKANQIADQLTLAIMGPAQSQLAHDEITQPNSLQNQIADTIKSIREFFGNKADRALAQTFEDFQKPSLDLFTFLRRANDPGNNLLLNFAWGNMYSHNKGDQRTTDLQG